MAPEGSDVEVAGGNRDRPDDGGAWRGRTGVVEGLPSNLALTFEHESFH